VSSVEVAPYWGLWCQTSTDALCNFFDWVHELLILLSFFLFFVFPPLIFTWRIFFLSSGPSTLATFVAVYALFGPTFPGVYDKERAIYTLIYPVCHGLLFIPPSFYHHWWHNWCISFQGLSFAFPIPSQYTSCCHEGEGAFPFVSN